MTQGSPTSRANPGLNDGIPLGILEADGDHKISCKLDGMAIGLKACFVKSREAYVSTTTPNDSQGDSMN